MIKLDMMKAFDRVNWQFLTKLLQRFGFDSRLITMIFNNLKGTYISILINGEPAGFFQPLRGVKQGDPLPPLLLVLASEAFSRGLNHLIMQGLYNLLMLAERILVFLTLLLRMTC